MQVGWSTLLAAIPLSVLWATESFDVEAYNKCSVNYNRDGNAFYVISAWAAVQVVFFIACMVLLRNQFRYVNDLSSMFTKPVRGIFYGEGEEQDPVAMKLKYHIPHMRIALVSLFTCFVQTGAQIYAIYTLKNSPSDTQTVEVVWILFPLNAVSGAVLGIFVFVYLILPERKMLWIACLRSTGLLQSYMECCGWAGTGLKVNYTFQASDIEAARADEAEYRKLVEQSELEDDRQIDEVIARTSSMLDYVDSASIGVAVTLGDSMSPRHAPQEDEIMGGGLTSNPAFRDRGDSLESLDLEGPIPDVLSPRSAYQ